MKGIIVVLDSTFLSLERLYSWQVFQKNYRSNLKNKDTRSTLLAEEILSHDFGNVTV